MYNYAFKIQSDSFVLPLTRLSVKSFSNSMHSSERLNSKLIPWLASLGLQFNPFDSQYLDAGADPFLASYLVGHQAFLALRQDQPSLVFAPVGGGKTAFRVRLARACRVGEDGRRVLPVVYTMPKPNQLLHAANPQERQLHFINQRLAAELLLAIAYRPSEYFALAAPAQRQVVAELQANFPGDLELQLAQLEHQGELRSLIQLVDPSADRMIAQPAPALLRQWCAVLRHTLHEVGVMVAERRQLTVPVRFHRLLQLAKETLCFEAIYLLVDGGDAYVEATFPQRRRVADLLTPLLQQTGVWAQQQFYAKYFLPTDFLQSIRLPELLAEAERVELTLIWIVWTKAMLNELLQERLRFASQGRFTDLDAICAWPLHGIQERLMEVAKPLPREVLALGERLLLEHIWRVAEPELLELIDFEGAVAWYQGGAQ